MWNITPESSCFLYNLCNNNLILCQQCSLVALFLANPFPYLFKGLNALKKLNYRTESFNKNIFQKYFVCTWVLRGEKKKSNKEGNICDETQIINLHLPWPFQNMAGYLSLQRTKKNFLMQNHLWKSIKWLLIDDKAGTKQNTAIPVSKALRKLHLIRMSHKDILHLWLLKIKRVRWHYLSTLLHNDVFHQGVKKVVFFNDFHAV